MSEQYMKFSVVHTEESPDGEGVIITVLARKPSKAETKGYEENKARRVAVEAAAKPPWYRDWLPYVMAGLFAAYLFTHC